MSSGSREREDAAYTELGADAWHENEDGSYYTDCPECGSAATLMNVARHGRCNGYLDQREAETELDEAEMDCTAKLWFELGYVSDPGGDDDTAAGDAEAVATDDAGADFESGEGVPGEGSPPGTDGTVSDDRQ